MSAGMRKAVGSTEIRKTKYEILNKSEIAKNKN
jgi:hypothetical protein